MRHLYRIQVTHQNLKTDMPNLIDLKNATTDFFKQYWNESNGLAPVWSINWHFFDTIPNHDKRGCYALLKVDEVVYIGSGIGTGFGSYKDCGLGKRLKKYWRLDKSENGTRRYKPSLHWSELTSIVTIGFPSNHYWIASSLEIYLINRLSPIKNIQHIKNGA